MENLRRRPRPRRPGLSPPFRSWRHRTGKDPQGKPCATQLHVKLEQQYVAVLNDVFLAFHAVEPLVSGGGDGTAADQIVVGNRLGFDEAALEIAVDDAGGLGRGVASVDRPRADLFLSGGAIGTQAKQ